MKFGFIHQHRMEFPITVMCNVLGVSRSGYYAWCKRPLSQRNRDNRDLGEKIQQFYQKSRGTYGSRRIWADLCEMGKGKYHKILSSNTLYFVLICVAGRILLVKQYQAAIPVQGGQLT